MSATKGASNFRKPIVGGNWKCNGTLKSTEALMEAFNAQGKCDSVDVVIAPASLHILHAKEKLRSDWHVAAQNCWTGQGAFTGEKSADQIADVGCTWVVLGHSERRQLIGEEELLVAQKAASALAEGLSVMLCIGETLEERESGQTKNVIHQQLQPVAELVSDWSKVVIAYEPIWAIGTGRVATPETAQETHADVRSWLAKNVSKKVASATRIIYGGSVKPDNAAGLLVGRDIDGFLVGGASLKPDFFSIIKNVAEHRALPAPPADAVAEAA